MNRLTGASIGVLVLIAGAIPITAYAVHDDEPSKQSAAASGPGRAHAEAMKEWARCVAEHAREDRPPGVRPKDLCPPKPVPPGRAKHGLGPAGPPPWAHHKDDKKHGKSDEHRKDRPHR